jgi:hypothetical protein
MKVISYNHFMTTQRLKPLSPGFKRIPLTFRRSVLPSATRSLSAVPAYKVHGHVMYVLASGTLYKVELSDDTKEKPDKPGVIESLTSSGSAWLGSAQLKVSLARSHHSVTDCYRPKGKTAPVMVDLATLEKFVEQKVIHCGRERAGQFVRAPGMGEAGQFELVRCGQIQRAFGSDDQ